MATTIVNVHFRIHYPPYRLPDRHLGFHTQADKDAFAAACTELLGQAGWVPAKSGYFYHPQHIGYIYTHPDDISGYFDAEALSELAGVIEALPRTTTPGVMLQYRGTDQYNSSVLHSASEITTAFQGLCPAKRDEALVAAMTTTRRSECFHLEKGIKVIAKLLQASSGYLDCSHQHAALHEALMIERAALTSLVTGALSQLVKQGVVKAVPCSNDAVLYRRLVRGKVDWVSPLRESAA